MEIAGRLGMTESEFELTTPRYMYYRQKAFEVLQVEAWQRTRIVAFYECLSPHIRKGAFKKATDLFKLPGDVKDIVFSETEKQKMINALNRAKGIDFFAGESIPAEA